LSSFDWFFVGMLIAFPAYQFGWGRGFDRAAKLAGYERNPDAEGK